MKNILSIIILTGIFAFKTYAQESLNKYTPQERARLQNEWMNKNLFLDTCQYRKISSLNIEYALKMEKVKEVAGRANKIKAARRISNEKDEKLKKILTEKQFGVYLDKRKELRNEAIEMNKER